MSTYDGSIIKVGNTLNLEQLVTELTSSLPCKPYTGSGGATSVASSTFSTCASVSVSCSLDEIYFVIGELNYSVSDGNASVGAIGLYRDSTVITTHTYKLVSADSSTGGERSSASIGTWVENISGTISFALKFARQSGSGTIYSAASEVRVLQLKKR